MVKYYDLNITYKSENNQNLKQLIDLSFKLGYYCLAVVNYDKVSELNVDNHELIIRKNIFTEDLKSLKLELRKFSKTNYLIAVYSCNRAVSSWCARDDRIKILSLDLNNIRYLHKNTIKIASDNETYFELSLFDMIFNKEYSMVKRISIISNKVKEILNYSGHIIITSKAENIFQIRAPRDLIATSTFFNIPEDYAKKAISEFPEKIVKDIG